MKTLKILFLLLFLVGFAGCCKEEAEGIDNPAVEAFVQQLRTKTYEASMKLPQFTHKDIPALLRYRNEKEMSTHFPRNPISSLELSECKLGIYMLWTIEGIRTETINRDGLLGGFPSQNPLLALRNDAELKFVRTDVSHREVAKAYADWWEKNKHKSAKELKKEDPLKNTDYRWF